jgi:Domain of unknown function (DUF1917)
MSQEPTITPDSVSNYSHLKEPFRSNWIRCLICLQVPTETVYHVHIPGFGSAACCSQECAEKWIESKEGETPTSYHEEDYDDPTPPTQAMQDGWIYARRKQGDYPDYTERSGKWLIWLSAETIDRYWQKIKEAVEQGTLGSAAAGSGRQKQGKPYVICVYTYDYADKADVMRIRQALRDLGIRKPIPYKADEDTERLRYGLDYTPIYRE